MAVDEHEIVFPKHMRWAYRCQSLLLISYFELNMHDHLVASRGYDGTMVRGFGILYLINNAFAHAPVELCCHLFLTLPPGFFALLLQHLVL